MKTGTFMLLIGILAVSIYMCAASGTIADQVANPVNPTPISGLLTGTVIDQVYLDPDQGVPLMGFLTVIGASVAFGIVGTGIAKQGCGGGVVTLILITVLLLGCMGLAYITMAS